MLRRWCDVRAVYFRNQTVGFAVVQLLCRSIGHFQTVFAVSAKERTEVTTMDETSRDKLSGAMCDFLSDVIHIADEGNYERDSFVKASAEMFKWGDTE